MMATITQAVASRRPRQRRLIAAQVHVSAALLLAAALLWNAGQKLDALGRWELQLILVVAAGLALIHAVLPWLLPVLSPRRQRTGIWQALILAAIPAFATTTLIGFSAVGACQLLLFAGVLAELGVRRRMLLVLWTVATIVYLVTLWHLRSPWL